jgi:sulfane dehydrogenase subunit SoxC
MGSESSRRELLKGGALAVGAVATGAVSKVVTPALADTTTSYALNEAPMVASNDATIAYGVRSHYVTSKRIQEDQRAVPANYTDFGLTDHIYSPLQDQLGTFQASSLHYFATTKGSFVPDIDPAQHTLTIQGLVNTPKIYTMADLKRFPSVSRFHFVECSANSHNATQTDAQAAHGAHTNAEWTGVLLSTLLKDAGLKPEAAWFIAEGAEEVKGADTLPLGKGLDDVIVAYGMNGEPVRPQNGYPLRLIVPGFEGIFNVKWLRRINVTDQYMLSMDDFGHLRNSPASAALGRAWGPKSMIQFPSGSQKLPEKGWYEITGLAWSGQGAIAKVEVSTDGGKTWTVAELKNNPTPMADVRYGLMWNWDGGDHLIMSRATDSTGAVQPTRRQVADYFGVAYTPAYSAPGLNNTIMAWQVGSDGSVKNGYASI